MADQAGVAIKVPFDCDFYEQGVGKRERFPLVSSHDAVSYTTPTPPPKRKGFRVESTIPASRIMPLIFALGRPGLKDVTWITRFFTKSPW